RKQDRTADYQIARMNCRAGPSPAALGTGAVALQPGAIHHARPMYMPVRVSILINSPSLMKSGTLMVLPVSSFAGLVTLLAVSPRTPSGDSTTFKPTEAGKSTCTGLRSA